MINDIKKYMQLVEGIQAGEVLEKEDVVEDSEDDFLTVDEKRDIIDGYLIAALWSSSDTDPKTGETVELDNYVFSDECKNQLTAIVLDFIDENSELLKGFTEEENLEMSNAGHTLWLSTNGHGSGFFDYNGESAIALDEITSDTKGTELYLGDDELVYCQ